MNDENEGEFKKRIQHARDLGEFSYNGATIETMIEEAKQDFPIPDIAYANYATASTFTPSQHLLPELQKWWVRWFGTT